MTRKYIGLMAAALMMCNTAVSSEEGWGVLFTKFRAGEFNSQLFSFIGGAVVCGGANFFWSRFSGKRAAELLKQEQARREQAELQRKRQKEQDDKEAVAREESRAKNLLSDIEGTFKTELTTQMDASHFVRIACGRHAHTTSYVWIAYADSIAKKITDINALNKSLLSQEMHQRVIAAHQGLGQLLNNFNTAMAAQLREDRKNKSSDDEKQETHKLNIAERQAKLQAELDTQKTVRALADKVASTTSSVATTMTHLTSRVDTRLDSVTAKVNNVVDRATRNLDGVVDDGFKRQQRWQEQQFKNQADALTGTETRLRTAITQQAEGVKKQVTTLQQKAVQDNNATHGVLAAIDSRLQNAQEQAQRAQQQQQQPSYAEATAGRQTVQNGGMQQPSAPPAYEEEGGLYPKL